MNLRRVPREPTCERRLPAFRPSLATAPLRLARRFCTLSSSDELLSALARATARGSTSRLPAPAPRPSSLSGVHSFSRASACSAAIGLASRDQLDRLARGEVLASVLQAPGACAGPRAASRARRPRARRRCRAPRAPPRRSARSLGLDDRGDHRLAAQRLLGLGRGLLDDLVLAAAGDLQVGLARDALVGERVQRALPQLARARLRRAPRAPRSSPARRRRPAPPRGTRPRRAARRASRRRLADVLAQLLELSKPTSAAKSSSSSGSCLCLTSLTVTAKWPPGRRAPRCRSRRGRSARRSAPRRRSRRAAPPRSRGSGARRRARRAGRGPRPP